jgi:hypothetical protein
MDTLASLHRSAGNAGSLEPVDPGDDGLGREPLGNPSRELLLRREHGRVAGNDVRSHDRRIVEPEQRQEPLSLRQVEACDGHESVGCLEAAVVRVHRDATRNLVGPCLEVRPIGDRRVVVSSLAGEPDEILELHGERGRQQRDVDELALTRLASLHQRGEDSGCEQEPGGEIRHRDPARADGNRVPV